MDTLCLLQSGIPGIVPLITSITATTTSRANDHVHVHQSHVSTVRRSSKSSKFYRFIGNSARNNCLAVDEVTAENVNRVVEEGDGQNGNWVFKVFDLNSVWKEEKKSGDNDEEECDVCRVDEEVDEEDDENEDEEIKFDRESFSRMLRRVTLVEARMYAHMSHLGNLAYSIPNIKVYFILHFLLCFHVFVHFLYTLGMFRHIN